jgi:hypothetical protein
MLAVLGAFAFLITPLPSLERIPVRVLFSAFAVWRSLSRSGLACGLAGGETLGRGVGFLDHFFFKLELALEVFSADDFVDFELVQIEVGSEVVFLRNRLATWFGWCGARRSRFGARLRFTGRSGASRRRFRARSLCLRRLCSEGGAVIEGQIFGAHQRFPGRFGSQVDAEEIFGQRFPRIFFATSARAGRICVHSRKIPVGSKRCKSLRTAGYSTEFDRFDAELPAESGRS